MPTSRFGTRAVGNARSTNVIAVADCSRSRPTGPLNFPTRTLSFDDGLKSSQASWRTATPPPKSGITLNSKYLPSVPCRIGRTRRSVNVLIASAPSSPEKKRPSNCT